MTYKTIYIDPPYPICLTGKYSATRNKRPDRLPYATMTIEEIASLPVESLAQPGCHIWLWTTNQFMRQGFDLLDKWRFKFLAPIHWIKPSGFGNYFIHRTQTILFGYYQTCLFPNARYLPNIFHAPSTRHSRKPAASYELIERISAEPRIELFARQARPGWTCLGDAIDGKDIRESLALFLT